MSKYPELQRITMKAISRALNEEGIECEAKDLRPERIKEMTAYALTELNITGPEQVHEDDMTDVFVQYLNQKSV